MDAAGTARAAGTAFTGSAPRAFSTARAPRKSLLDAAAVLFVHAHPDDETIATGGLIAEFVSRGATVSLLTATRGERGEVVPGPLAHLAGTPEIVRHRERELECATRALGIHRQLWLGTSPARAAGKQPRQYRDSGMRWIAEGLAGPADESGPEALTAAPLAEVVADVAAAIDVVRPQLLISYDATGGYGHPDHVRMHEASRDAAAQSGVAFAELVAPGEVGDDIVSFDTVLFSVVQHRAVVDAALACHASQLTRDGDEIVHSGGQRQAIEMTVALRRVSA